jgi:hypothetical protein
MATVAEFNIDFTDLKVLTEHLNTTEKAVDMTAKSASKNFRKLELSIDPVARATKTLKDQMLVLQTAKATNSISNEKYAKTFKMIQANAKAAGITINQFGQVVGSNTRGMKKFGAVGMQQVGYQVQDFAVQVQGGTSAMVALGQQGSQLLGIFGPAGAIAGMILAIGTGLVGAFNAAKSASADALEVHQNYSKAMKTSKSRVEELVLQNYMFKEGIEDTAVALNSLSLQAIQAQMEAYAAMGTFDKMMFNLKNRLNFAISGDLEDQRTKLQKTADLINELIEKYKANQKIEDDKKDAEDREKSLAKRIAALAKEQSLRYGMAQLSEREALIYKQQTEMAQELLTLRKLGLVVGSVDEKHVIKMIQARHDEELATYDLKEAEKALEEQRKLDAESQKARAARLKEELKQALKDNADVLESSKAIGSAMEDAMMAMVDGTKSVKDAFKDMASAIIKDLYRIYVVKKITGMITGAIDSYLAPGVGEAQAAVAGVAANGGPVQAGQRYVVGERGPEMFTPNVSGTITPNSQMGGSGVTVVQNINISTGVQQTVRAEIRQMMPQIAQSAKAAVVDSKRRGGNYGRAMA